MKDSKFQKPVSKGSNFCEVMSINWNKRKREIEIGLDSSIERIVSANLKVTTEEFLERKIKILQEVDNKIISLKYRTKVYKTNPLKTERSNLMFKWTTRKVCFCPD